MKQEKRKDRDVCDAFIRDFQGFETQLNGHSSTPFHKQRVKAIAAFAEQGFPTTRQEKWKYTNIAPLLKETFQLAIAHEISETEITPFLFSGMENDRLVFVNGHFDSALSSFTLPKSVIISNLDKAYKNYSAEIDAHLGKHLQIAGQPFAALNTAFAHDGLFIYVPRNVRIEKPLHLLFISQAQAEMPNHQHPRNLIILEQGSQLQLVESHHCLGENVYLSNNATEFVVGENASLDHIRIQDDSKNAYHFSATQIKVARDARYNGTGIDLGGKIARNDINVEFTGENAEAQLLGFYYATGAQLLDNHTFIDHAVPHCNSNELFKGFMDDHSHGVFNGAVLVRPDAQKTNAFQQNQAILISKNATVDAKPELEIFADDVLCSHGATIGEIEDEQLFYLRSRGISEEMAKAMLHIAFANDIFERIKIDAVREKLEAEIIKRFSEK